MSSEVPAQRPYLQHTPMGRRTLVLSGLALLAAGT